MAKATEGGSLVTLRPAGERGDDNESGWESEHDSGMAAAMAASMRETDPMVSSSGRWISMCFFKSRDLSLHKVPICIQTEKSTLLSVGWSNGW